MRKKKRIVSHHKITVVDVQAESQNPSDIYLHLLEMYNKVVEVNARVVVELGVRTGIYTKAFLAGVHETNRTVCSLDLDKNCKNLFNRKVNRWVFMVGDSRSFDWGSFSEKLGMNRFPNIDVLFIDTDHTVDSTTQELAHWVPFVRVGGYILCHDTIYHEGNRPEVGGDGVLQPILNMINENPGKFEFAHRDY